MHFWLKDIFLVAILTCPWPFSYYVFSLQRIIMLSEDDQERSKLLCYWKNKTLSSVSVGWVVKINDYKLGHTAQNIWICFKVTVCLRSLVQF